MAGTQNKRCPGGSRGPLVSRTSSRSIGPGFRRDSDLAVVSSRVGRPEAGGELKRRRRVCLADPPGVVPARGGSLGMHAPD